MVDDGDREDGEARCGHLGVVRRGGEGGGEGRGEGVRGGEGGEGRKEIETRG